MRVRCLSHRWSQCRGNRGVPCQVSWHMLLMWCFQSSEGGMIWLETLIELKLITSSFSSSHFPIRAFRAYPLVDIKQTNSSLSSNSRQVERFELRVPRSTVPSPPLISACATGRLRSAEGGQEGGAGKGARGSWHPQGATAHICVIIWIMVIIMIRQ